MGRIASRLGNGGLSPLYPNRPQIVAGNGTMPTFRYNNATYTRAESRKSYRLGGQAVSQLRLAYCGFFDNGAAGEATLGNDYQVQSAIELASPVTYQRGYVNGAAITTVSDGAPVVLTDPIGYDMAADTDFFVRTGLTVSAANLYLPSGSNPRGADVGWVSANSTSQVPGTGYMNQPAGSSYYDPTAPYMVLGIPSAPLVSVALMGDSFGEGQGDTVTNSSGVKGYLQRGLWSVNGHVVPSVNLSKGSEMAQNNQLTLGSRKRAAWPYATHLLCALGRNDIGAGRTLLQIQTDLIAIWTAAKRTKGPYGKPLHVTQTLMPPSTSSTDNWATAANQTPTSGFAAGGVRDQLNAWIIAQAGQGLLDAYVNLNVYWEDQSNPNKWVTNGSNNYATSDGVHPSAALHLLASAAISNWALTLTP